MAPEPLGSPAKSTQPDPRPAHGRAIVTGRVDRFLCNRLITHYANSGHSFSYFAAVFRQIPKPNFVSWTALISADTDAALRHFVAMLRRNTLPNHRTAACLLRSCASLAALRFGLGVHSLSLKLSLSSDPFAGSALISFYAKFRLPRDTRKAFDEIHDKDEVCFSAVVVALALNSRPAEAVSAFGEMIRGRVRSTATAISGALRGSAELASLEQSRVIHCHAVVTGLDLSPVVASALVDAYGKAGLVSEARRVFDERSATLNEVGWNAMMAGYAQQGDPDSALDLFQAMEQRGFEPDDYTFLALLTSFSNAGADLEAERWFARFTLDYKLEPRLEHYTCLIGSLARAGRVLEAEKLAVAMPLAPDAAVWRTILSACAIHGQPDMALRIGNRILEIDPSDDSAFVMAANALSGAGRWEEVARVRRAMREGRVRKVIGRSWVEVRGTVHVFFAGDRRHEMSGEIYAKLGELMEEIEKLGYVPVWDEVSRDVGEAEKREALGSHSEKLAVAFGVLSAAAPGTALRVVKNLRICRDCHEAFKFMSVALEREIIVRDVHRYHIFSNGDCTCKGQW